MAAFKSEEEIELRIQLRWFTLIYPIHIYNPIIPKVALREYNHYWFSIADIKGKSSAENKTFCSRAERPHFLHHVFFEVNEVMTLLQNTGNRPYRNFGVWQLVFSLLLQGLQFIYYKTKIGF